MLSEKHCEVDSVNVFPEFCKFLLLRTPEKTSRIFTINKLRIRFSSGNFCFRKDFLMNFTSICLKKPPSFWTYLHIYVFMYLRIFIIFNAALCKVESSARRNSKIGPKNGRTILKNKWFWNSRTL